MSKKELPIPFKIVKVEENQFSLFEETLKTEASIQQQIGFGFGIDIDKSVIAVSMEFILNKNTHPLLKQEISCYFELESEAFKSLQQKDQLVLPCNFAKHLAMITTGTARGVLFANTKNTAFNMYIIGLLNMDKMFSEDIIVTINNQ